MIRSSSGKQRLVVAAVVAGVLALSACSSGGQNEGAGSLTDVSGQYIGVVVPSEPKGLSPIMGTVSDARSYGPMFDALIPTKATSLELDTDNGLLTSWTRSDELTWVFDVRKNVTFSNGEAWDAEAAAFSINVARNEPSSNLRGFFSFIQNAYAQNDQLVVKTTVPNASLSSLLGGAFGLPPKYYASVGGFDGFNAAPVGTGPYVLDQYNRGTGIKYKANPTYWQGPVKVAGLDVSFVPDPATRAAQIASGSADLAIDLSTSIRDQYKSDARVETVSAPSSNITVLLMRPVGDLVDVRAREAIQYAIDREALVRGLFGDQAAVLKNIFSDIKAPAVAPDEVAYDPNKAKELLAAVGHPVSIKFSYVSGRSANDTQAGEAIAAMLEDVGVKVVRDPLPYNNYLEKQLDKSLQVGFTVQFKSATPASFITDLVLTTSRYNYCPDPEMDRLYSDASVALDPNDVAKYFTDMEVRWVNSEACAAPIYSFNSVYLTSPRVKDFEPPYNGAPRYNKITLG